MNQALVQFNATLEAAVREVHVDVSAFKLRIEQKIEELCVSHGPLAGAVTRLQEENLQLRAKLEALSRLVEGLAEGKAKSEEGSLENGHAQIQPKNQEDQGGSVVSGRSENGQSSLSGSTCSEPSGSSAGSSHAAAPSSTPVLPPWRAKRHAEINVSTFSFFFIPRFISTEVFLYRDR